MDKELKISAEKALAAYNNSDANGKELLEHLFGKELFAQDIKDKVKTFEDAMLALGEEHPLVKEWHCGENLSSDLEAYLQLRVICAALNEGWEPQFTEDEWRWFPWHYLWTESELDEKSDEWKADRHLIMIRDKYKSEYAGLAEVASSNAPSGSDATFGYRLCLKSEALATYCGKQFIDLWAAFLLTPKK